MSPERTREAFQRAKIYCLQGRGDPWPVPPSTAWPGRETGNKPRTVARAWWIFSATCLCGWWGAGGSALGLCLSGDSRTRSPPPIWERGLTKTSPTAEGHPKTTPPTGNHQTLTLQPKTEGGGRGRCRQNIVCREAAGAPSSSLALLLFQTGCHILAPV